MSKEKEGQVLLLIILLSATIFAVAGAIFFESMVQTQVTKIQEESIRALKAAEGLAEEALKSKTSLTLDPNEVNLPAAQGEAQIVSTESKEFITPLLNKDEQYTFYLTTYDPKNNSFGSAVSPSFKIEPEDSNICSSNSFILELTFINVENENISRKIIGCSGESFVENNFGRTFTAPIASHLLIMRVIYKDSDFPGVRLKITRTDGNNWPSQGTTVVSTVTTASGIQKKVRVFQSHPQIPSEFFVTRF